MVAHILRPKPPLVFAATTALSAACRSACDGKSLLLDRLPSSSSDRTGSVAEAKAMIKMGWIIDLKCRFTGSSFRYGSCLRIRPLNVCAAKEYSVGDQKAS